MQQGAFLLEGIYRVEYHHRSVGKVQLIQQGLYYRVICRCECAGDEVLRLFAESESGRENLGVMLPEDGTLRLDRKVPAKQIPKGKLRFFLSAGAAKPEGNFIPICPQEPFAYIEALKDAFLATEHGKIGIVIRKDPEAF